MCDRLVLPTLTPNDITRVAAGELSLDARTRDYIGNRFGFRYTTTVDGAAALELEHHTRAGGLGPLPLLNPATTGPA